MRNLASILHLLFFYFASTLPLHNICLTE